MREVKGSEGTIPRCSSVGLMGGCMQGRRNWDPRLGMKNSNLSALTEIHHRALGFYHNCLLGLPASLWHAGQGDGRGFVITTQEI